jgi:hypothetical protein
MLPAARSGAAAAFEEKFDRMITFGGAFSSGVTSLLASLNADAVSPAQVTDFGGTVYCTRIDFSWTDSGDDGLVGPPRAYDLRKNSVAITDANWDASSYVTSGACLGLGQAELFSLSLGACSARYYYAVKVRDEAFNWSPISNTTWKIGTPCPPPHAICFDDEFARSGPSAAELTLASANPSRDPFTVLLSVPSDQTGTPYHVAIYDLAGRTVHDLDRGRAEAGRMTMTWDLTDGAGVRVHEGMYFLRLNLGARVLTKTLVVMR